MPKYISGRSKKTPQSALSADRYRYLSVGDAEPNLGDSPSVQGSPDLPAGQQYIVVSFIDRPGERFWIPNQGGIIPGSLSVFEEGTLVGGLSSTTQLDFRGNAITATGVGGANPGVAVTVTVVPPGNNNSVLFKNGDDFSTDTRFTFDNGLFAAGDRITVGTGGTIVTTNANGFVGIGTIDPTQRLHLDGNFRITGTIYDSTNQPGNTGDLLVKELNGGLLWTRPQAVISGAGGTIGQIQFHNAAGLVGGAEQFYYDFNNHRVGIGSTQPKELLDVVGVSTFVGNSFFNHILPNKATVGFLTATNSYLGVTTIGSAEIGFATVTNAYLGFTTIGFATVTHLHAGVATVTDLDVTNLDLENLYVSGISSLGNIRVDGVSNPNTLTTLSGNLIIDSQGQRTQINDILLVDNTTQSTNKDNGSIYTQGGVGIEKNLNVGGAVSFTGPSVGVAVTLAAAGGITTTGGDLYVGGNLYVKDDIFYDDLSGEDMVISGIATINQLEIGKSNQTLVGITTILDEDDMASDRDDALATQQSIKKYVDDQVSAVDLDFAGDSGSGAVDLDSQTFTISGTSNEIETSAANQTLTIGLPDDVTITGNLTVNGNTTLGDANTDSVVFNAEVDSNIIPDDDNTYNLGSINKKWGNVHATTFNGAFQGTADIAKKLETPREISFSQDVVAVAKTFDGTQNVGFALTLQDIVTGSTVGSTTQVGVVTFDNKGRITAASNVDINFNDANVATADSLSNSRNIAATGDIAWNVDFKGHEDVTAGATLASIITQGTVGSTTQVGVVTFDTKGRITAASNVDIDFANATVGNANYADNAGLATDIKINGVNQLLYQQSNNNTNVLPAGNQNQLLQSNGSSSAPSWVNPSGLLINYADNAGIATNLKGGVAYQIPYQSAADTTQFISNGSVTGELLQYNQGSAPSWVSPTNLTVNNANFATIAGYSTNSGIATIATYTSEWDVVNGGASSYNFTGPGNLSGTANPTIYLTRGEKYKFKINAPGHPFWIKTSATTGTGNQYNTGVTNNGTQSGTILFDVPMDAPNTLYYICQYHGGMQGTIYILDQTDANDDTTYTLPASGNPSAVTITLTGSDSTTDPVTITAGNNIAFHTISADGFTIASSGGGTGTLTDLDVKQFSDENTPRTEYGCSNPIDVTIAAGIATIGIGSTSNAYGKRYVGSTEPTTDVCDGDIWYDTSTSTEENSGNGFVTGMIMMFSGTVAPSGWVLCDNSAAAQAANAPDLRDRFIVGTGNNYSLNATGGSANAVLIAHDHTYGRATYRQLADGGAHGAELSNVTTDTTSTEGRDVNGSSSTTQTGTNANLPPYYALAFIMKT